MYSRTGVVVLVIVSLLITLLLATVSLPSNAREKDVTPRLDVASHGNQVLASPTVEPPTPSHARASIARTVDQTPLPTVVVQQSPSQRHAVVGHHNPVQFVHNQHIVTVSESDVNDPVRSYEDDIDYEGLNWLEASDLEDEIDESELSHHDPSEVTYCETLRHILENEEATYMDKESWKRYNHTALASFPRSGNTWTRIVLQELTGIISGSVYEDKLAPEPLLRIPGTEDVLVVKTHRNSLHYKVRHGGDIEDSDEEGKFDAVILIVRNPFDAVMSDLNHSFSHSFATTIAHLTSQMKSHARQRFADWKESVETWMNFYMNSGLPFLLLRYEDMLDEPKIAFKQILAFIGRKVDEERLDCVLMETACERHHDSCRLGHTGSSFDVWDLSTVTEQEVLLEKELELLGYRVSHDSSPPSIKVLPMGKGSTDETWTREDVEECLAAQRPNILFVLSDDQRSDAIGYANKEVRSPNLDALARSGVIYRNAHSSSPFCSPSRMAILKGRREQRNGVWTGPVSAPAWPAILSDMGFHTSMSGKYHTDAGGTIDTMGFTSYSGVFNGGMHDYKNIPVVSSREPSHPVMMYDSPTKVFTDATMHEISLAIDSGKRFAHWLTYTAPHDPRVPNPIAYREDYQQRGVTLQQDWAAEPLFDPGVVMTVRQELRYPRPLRREDWEHIELPGYYGLVSQMDDEIGRLMSFLREKQVFNNTIIVFGSDNGLMMGSHGLVAKQIMYEESLRVPLFITGPCVGRGVESNAMVDLMDLFPTLVDIAGGNSRILDIDAISMLSILHPTDAVDAEFREDLLCSYGDDFIAVKTKKWKLVHNVLVDKVELFNLEDDPMEQMDLAGSVLYREVQATLEGKLMDMLAEIHAKA